MCAAPHVRFVSVTKTFRDGTTALRDLSFEIRRGEFVALLGPSGCGKSTALRLAAGLTPPSAGHIEVWDRHSIGFVFQSPTLMPWATVSENVRLPFDLGGTADKEADARVRAALNQVGLAERAGAHPGALSGGMQMRVSIARALAPGPSLLLMDEPFAALDEQTRFRLNDDLLALWARQGWTVLFVTHSLQEAAYLSQRVLVMGGRPGALRGEVAFEAPGERGRDFRLSSALQQRCRPLADLLGEAAA